MHHSKFLHTTGYNLRFVLLVSFGSKANPNMPSHAAQLSGIVLSDGFHEQTHFMANRKEHVIGIEIPLS
jgi:hypothetical protein